MDATKQEVVDKVIALLRDGASAATGAAKDGFILICQYKSSEAVASLMVLVLLLIASTISLIMAARHIKGMTQGLRPYTYYNCPSRYNSKWKDRDSNEVMHLPSDETLEEHPGVIVWIVVSGVALGIAIIFMSIAGPTLYATFRNPQGAVLTELISRLR